MKLFEEPGLANSPEVEEVEAVFDPDEESEREEEVQTIPNLNLRHLYEKDATTLWFRSQPIEDHVDFWREVHCQVGYPEMNGDPGFGPLPSTSVLPDPGPAPDFKLPPPINLAHAKLTPSVSKSVNSFVQLSVP